MAFLFGGGRATASNPIREYQTELRHAARGIDREDARAIQQERRLQAEILHEAQARRFPACAAKGKELVRLRSHRARLATMKGHMTSLAQQLSAVGNTHGMQQIVAKTTRLLQGLNQRTDARAIHRQLLEFERQSAHMQAKQEVMEETLDNIFEADGEEEATDDALASVFTEIGLDSQAVLAGARASRPQAGGQALAPPDDDFEARLARLKRTG